MPVWGKTHHVTGSGRLIRLARSRADTNERMAFRALAKAKASDIKNASKATGIPEKEIIREMWHVIATTNIHAQTAASVAFAVQRIQRRKIAYLPAPKG